MMGAKGLRTCLGGGCKNCLPVCLSSTDNCRGGEGEGGGDLCQVPPPPPLFPTTQIHPSNILQPGFILYTYIMYTGHLYCCVLYKF